MSIHQVGVDGLDLPDVDASRVQVVDPADTEVAKLNSANPHSHADGVQAEITLARHAHAVTAPPSATQQADGQPEMAKLSEIGHAMLGRMDILKAGLKQIMESGASGDTLQKQMDAFVARVQSDSGKIAREVHELASSMVGRLQAAAPKITGEVAAKVSLTLDLIREAPPAAIYEMMMDLARSGDPAWPYLRPIFERYAITPPKHWVGMRDAINSLLAVPYDDPAAVAREAERMADDWVRMIEGRLMSQATELTDIRRAVARSGSE